MLVLSRKSGESIVINGNITVTVVEIRGDHVRLGIDAPREITIHREEIHAEMAGANREAAGSSPVDVGRLPRPDAKAEASRPEE
ncbi:MAG: carbon storage regulator CsrA [Microthrixaceae bacterium]